jgi:hypothetical protein
MWIEIKKASRRTAIINWWDEWIAWAGSFEYKCCDW